MNVSESSTYSNLVYNDSQYIYLTKLDLEIMFHADRLEQGQKRVELLIKNAKGKMPHPDFPKNKDMTLYRVFKAFLQGEKEKHLHEEKLQLEKICQFDLQFH